MRSCIQDHVGRTAKRALVFAAADAVEEVEARIHLIPEVSWWSIDLRPALQSHHLRVVLDELQLAMIDALAGSVETLRRRSKPAFTGLCQYRRA